MNLFQFGWLGCLAQPYFHIYFNKQCRVGTRKHMLDVHTLGADLLPNMVPLEGGVQGLPATVPSILEKNRALGLAWVLSAEDELVCDGSCSKKCRPHAKRD